MNKISKAIPAMSLMALLAACGGGKDADTVSSTSQPVTGRVADGYINGATVFWDCNNDVTPNDGEITTKSGAGGTFSIAVAPSANCTLAAYIPIGAIDEDKPTQSITRPYTLLSIQGNEQFISPIGTLVRLHQQSSLTSTEQSKGAIASALGISGQVLDDYLSNISADSTRRHAVAKIITVILQNNNTPSNISSSLGESYLNIQAISASINSANLSTNIAVESFISPLQRFLEPMKATTFASQTVEKYLVRPNSQLSLTTTQADALNAVIKLPAIQRVTRLGVIHWAELTNLEFDETYSILLGKDILPDDGNPSIVAVRAQRTAFLQLTSDYFSAQIAGRNKWFASNVSANFQFFVSTSLSGFEAVGGAVSVATGLPAPDIRRFRGQPNWAKGVIKSTTNPKIKDVVVALLSALTLPIETRSKIDEALSKGDSEAFSKAEYESLLAAVDQLITIQKDILKQGDFGLAGKFFGPALKVYGVSQECTQAATECYSASLQLVETIAEWMHAPARVQGGLMWLRATFDAYSQGKEYAKATSAEVTDDWERILTDWDTRISSMKLTFKQLEFTYGGYEKYFESYDPSVPCAEGMTLNQYAACVTPSRDTLFLDGFDSAVLDASKWTVEALNGNLASSNQSGGFLNVNVPGGSCGVCGVSDGARLKPKVGAIPGDFEVILSAEELGRTSRDQTQPLSTIQLLMTGSNEELGIYVVGDVISNQGISGHQIITYFRNGNSVTYPSIRNLAAGQYYAMQFRIRRSVGISYLAYKLADDQIWTEAIVPSSFPPTAVFTPSIVVASGDGGSTRTNSSLRARFDFVSIRH